VNDSADARKWTVYTLTKDGVPYFVGRTSRPVEARVSEHVRTGRANRANDSRSSGGSRGVSDRLRVVGRRSRQDASMDNDRFWALIERARTADELQAELVSLSEADFAGFERRHDEVFHGSYDWRLWAAAYLIGHGCSDDEFDYFRAWLISRGRDTFTTALADPDSLAELEMGDGSEWEDWMSPTMTVIHARTGRYEFATNLGRPFRWPREPSGDPWDDLDDRALAARFPRIATKYP
jgi:hypothetical protein